MPSPFLRALRGEAPYPGSRSPGKVAHRPGTTVLAKPQFRGDRLDARRLGVDAIDVGNRVSGDGLRIHQRDLHSRLVLGRLFSASRLDLAQQSFELYFGAA